jgi:ABC-type transporter Mla MlaB component
MLQIQPQPSTEALFQQFTFIGTVDVNATAPLETLYILPRNCAVEVDFEAVQRVNSMGLAQLLKLFEHWQKCGISIRILHVNRMIGVLFKMTGLTRFLSDSPPPASTSVPAIADAALENRQPMIAVDTGKLKIQPPPSPKELFQQFTLIGTVDIEAVSALERLYILPSQSAVELNFALVERVNSMGLAQLLKLFEYWQKRNITIRVTHTNRMIGVLFKMTGLTRFLSDEQAPVSPSSEAGAGQPVPQKKVEQAFTAKPGHRESIERPEMERRINPILPSAPTENKLNLLISAQSSQQMNGWYFFNTYLQKRLGREIHLELVHGAMGERRLPIERMDMVFTKPFEATRLLLEYNFHPLIRPIDQTDEVTLLVRTDDPRQSLADFQGGKIVTAAQDNFVYLLGRFLLEEDESALADMDYLFSGHDIKALQMLLKGAADILFMLSDTYNGLSGLTRKMLRKIDQSETAFAFHLFCIAPHRLELGEAVAEVLLDMGRDSQGRQVLADLGIEGWCKPTQDEINMLVMLFNRYAGAHAPLKTQAYSV